VFVIYEGRSTSGKRFRNSEILTVHDGKIVDVEVYFGWAIPHEAAEGGFAIPRQPNFSTPSYIIGTLESRFRKRQGNCFPLADQEAVSCDAECRVMMKDFHLTSGLCITNRTA
jgi:hypothetical protein